MTYIEAIEEMVKRCNKRKGTRNIPLLIRNEVTQESAVAHLRAAAAGRRRPRHSRRDPACLISETKRAASITDAIESEANWLEALRLTGVE